MTENNPHPLRLWRSVGAVLLGFVVSTIGAITTIPMKLGPAWYPIALVLTALPFAWLGGALERRRHAA
jgi:hypothetical protein